MKAIKSFCLLIATVLFCACSSDISEELTVGSIAGSVSDKTTGEPVATVNVSINPGGYSTVTGSDGSFSFLNLAEGSYTLTISKEGYKQSNNTVSVHIGEPTSAHLLIERIPAVITADRELLDFGENLTTLSFTIVNTGYTDLAYKIETGRCEWLSADPETDIL
ncbi:MAG: carboxypeptidase-like regulatory domain-containing protein, partial [Bacteroidaceae bacterium]|nr:carboxypeptidase-like regulatory domain-containing protein [Bacteroidaceae bacterium]